MYTWLQKKIPKAEFEGLYSAEFYQKINFFIIKDQNENS